MSFAEYTGRTKPMNCTVCGASVTHREARVFAAPNDRFHWTAVAHRAPCGAHCGGGGYNPDENDVHIPPFGACPRCGATDTAVARIIERPGHSERVVIHRYTREYCRELGFRIDLEACVNGSWTVRSRWPTNHPDSLERTVECAKNYVPWLKEL